MIEAMITMLCGITSLFGILRQQHYIQLQNEEIQRIREVLSLRDEQLGLYKNMPLCFGRRQGVNKKSRSPAGTGKAAS